MTESVIPLCVDLDGTLIRSDLLVETLLALLTSRPWLVFKLPFWLMRGKAHLKRQIARQVAFDPSILPYDERILELIRVERDSGRPVELCTASDAQLAGAVATHLGVFSGVHASDGQTNLSGSQKAAALVAAHGERGFDYAGNAAVDLKVWRHAHGAVVVGSERLATRAAAETKVLAHLPEAESASRSWLRALRLHQWLKNLLVFLPLLAAHRAFDPVAVGQAIAGFIAFGLCASGVYLLNDLMDLAADRRHPRKRRRPFAAGNLSLVHGACAVPVLTVAAFALALVAVRPAFAAVLGLYWLTTLAYSLGLKRVVMLDVLMLAGLYTIRIIGGAAAMGSALSFWLLAFSMFIFLSLAMLKRYIELKTMLAAGKERASGRGYGVDDLPLIQSLGGSAGYLAVLVLALYINSPESLKLYRTPHLLWLLCPMLLYWMSRVWVVAHRGEMDDDPVVFAATDKTSLVVIAVCGGIVLGAI